MDDDADKVSIKANTTCSLPSLVGMALNQQLQYAWEHSLNGTQPTSTVSSGEHASWQGCQQATKDPVAPDLNPAAAKGTVLIQGLHKHLQCDAHPSITP